ncbi:MAG: cupredoxin family copper-binding protein [Gemmatimonadota bacterium]
MKRVIERARREELMSDTKWRSEIRRRSLASLVLTALVAASCGGPDGDGAGGDRAPAPAAAPAAAPADVVEIDISGLSFSRKDVTIRPGTTVRWVNRDEVAHTTTADGQEWDSKLIQPGGSFERTFPKPGRFAYHCIPHPFMRAAIVVEAQ